MMLALYFPGHTELLVNPLITENLMWHSGRHCVILQRRFSIERFPVILPLALIPCHFFLCTLNPNENWTLQLQLEPIAHVCHYLHCPLHFTHFLLCAANSCWCIKIQLNAIFSKWPLLTSGSGWGSLPMPLHLSAQSFWYCGPCLSPLMDCDPFNNKGHCFVNPRCSLWLQHCM